jgi:hypothetical protein
MKLLSTFLLLALPAHVLSADINYETLSNRFVTSVKEAQVDADFLKIQEVQDCVAQNSITNVQSKDEILKKQRDAANCLRAKLASVPDGDLTKLGEKLQLDAYGVVKGKSNQALVDYLSGRLEKALYGTEGGKVVSLGKQKLVDQKVFVDIYETQLGKNILLEVSNYCFNRLDIDEDNNKSRLKELSLIGVNGINGKIGALQDEQIINPAFSITDADNIYEKIRIDLEDVTTNLTNRKTPAEALNDLFLTCARAIPKMCEYYEDCLCRYKESRKTEFPNTPTCNSNPTIRCAQRTFNEPPKKGSHSCHVASRLRGYRTNLEAVKTTKDRFDKEYLSLENTKEYQGKERYRKENTGPNESIDDLTSITTSDVDEALKVNELANEIGAIPDDCAAEPEKPECEKFFYKESEVQKFAQSSAGYSAATLLESEKINKLASKDDELKKYLMARGYFDLEKDVGTRSSAEIVAAARSRFEAEREATFIEMTNAFERKQFTTDLKDNKATRAEEVKKEYQNKGKAFQQLILFNNVVSSYLTLRSAEDGKELGRNLKALERETKRSENNSQAGEAIKYFSGISGDEKSQLNDSDSPVVDMGFLDAILGKDAPATTGTNPNGPGT